MRVSRYSRCKLHLGSDEVELVYRRADGIEGFVDAPRIDAALGALHEHARKGAELAELARVAMESEDIEAAQDLLNRSEEDDVEGFSDTIATLCNYVLDHAYDVEDYSFETTPGVFKTWAELSRSERIEAMREHPLEWALASYKVRGHHEADDPK